MLFRSKGGAFFYAAADGSPRVRALEADTPQAALVDTCRTLKLSAEGARKLAEHLEDLIQAHAHESGDDAQPFVLRLALAADPT